MNEAILTPNAVLSSIKFARESVKKSLLPDFLARHPGAYKSISLGHKPGSNSFIRLF